MYYQTLFVICCVVFSNAEDYQDSLKKLWHKNSETVNDVTSASAVIQPSTFQNQYARDAKMPYYRTYAFKPRAISTREASPVVTANFYTDDVKNNSNRLFPGNYLSIAKEKGDASEGRFFAKAIPLIRTNEFQRRSFDVEEPIIEKPEGFSEVSETKRSISYILGEDTDDEYNEYEDEDGKEEERQKFGKKKIKPKKLKKYMLPLLLAYKMKYFALVPIMIGGLVLLVGATGLAGFFFALFAAVMGLQKGNY